MLLSLTDCGVDALRFFFASLAASVVPPPLDPSRRCRASGCRSVLRCLGPPGSRCRVLLSLTDCGVDALRFFFASLAGSVVPPPLDPSRRCRASGCRSVLRCLGPPGSGCHVLSGLADCGVDALRSSFSFASLAGSVVPPPLDPSRRCRASGCRSVLRCLGPPGSGCHVLSGLADCGVDALRSSFSFASLAGSVVPPPLDPSRRAALRDAARSSDVWALPGLDVACF